MAHVLDRHGSFHLGRVCPGHICLLVRVSCLFFAAVISVCVGKEPLLSLSSCNREKVFALLSYQSDGSSLSLLLV